MATASRAHTPLLAARGAALVGAALMSQGCLPTCGVYRFDLVDTLLVDDRIDPRAFELCGDDVGTQGGWVPDGESYVSFQPGERGLGVNFATTNMLITAVFRTADAVDGAVLTGGSIGGIAFYGLGFPERYDESSLLSDESRLVFHAVGEEDPEDTSLYRRRVVDLEWDLVWSNGSARWTARGRDDVPMLREAY